MIWRTLDTIVITETYRSPPVTARTLLQQMVTRLLVSCMINPAVPRLTMFFNRVRESASSRNFKSFTLYSALLCKKFTTKAADKNWDKIVAMAAPLIPKPNTKIKIGSRIRFVTAPRATDNIPTVEYPCELMKGFIPVAIIEATVPRR